MFYTYILFSPSLDQHYIGQTRDLHERLAYHLAGSTPETARSKDWKLVFVEEFQTRAEAMALEKRIKRAKSRKSILRFLAHPLNQVASFVG